MIQSVKARTPILVLILFVFAVGYTFAANNVVVIPLGADAAQQSFAVFDDGQQALSIGNTPENIRSVDLTAPTNGVVIVNSTVGLIEAQAGDGVNCSISKEVSDAMEDNHTQVWISGGTPGASRAQLAGTRGFNVIKGAGYTFKLVCVHTGTDSTATYLDSSITATFTPSA